MLLLSVVHRVPFSTRADWYWFSKLSIKREIDQQHVDCRFSQDPKRSVFYIRFYYGLHSIWRDPARLGNSRHLPEHAFGREVRIESARRSSNELRRNGLRGFGIFRL